MADKPDIREQYQVALAEVAEMKRTLAERARRVGELEDRLMRQVEDGARGHRLPSPRRRAPGPEPTESDLARAVAAADAEKAAAQAERKRLDDREQKLRKVEERLKKQVEAQRRAPGPEPTESDLARAVAAADAEKALAQAERERLDERERTIRKVERELAGLRMQLEKEWRRLKGTAPPAQPPSEDDPQDAARVATGQ